MTNILELNSIRQEAKYLQEMNFNVHLLEILIGDRNGTIDERMKMSKIHSRLGNKIFIEIIYLLTREVWECPLKAEAVCNAILDHKSALVYKLGRPVSIQVAALDYMQNVLNHLKKPILIEEKKIMAIAKRAVSDELTRTYSGSLIKGDLEIEIERSKRYDLPLSVSFMDIDNFKKINDSYGHQAGNKILQQVTDILKKNVRKTDSVYRYGGDELVLIFPGITSSQASNTAGHIRKLLKKIKINGSNPAPTVSMGIASYDKINAFNPETLLNAADAALYEAKRLGKDRVCIYETLKNAMVLT